MTADMATLEERVHSFDSVERVVANEEKFKARVGAGASAFASLRVADIVNDVWNVGGAAGTGATVAASPSVATTFFAPNAIASFFGATALTPFVWVLGSAAAAGGLYFGVVRLFRTYYGSRVDAIPRFLNSPVDVLGASFLDLVGSLAIKVASIDGRIDDRERKTIREYFVDEWGFDPEYAAKALDLLEEKTEDQRITEMATTLAEFARTSPDCDFTKIQKGLSQLLTEISEADGKLDEREEMAIERIVAALNHENSTYSSIKRAASAPVRGVASIAGWAQGKLGVKPDQS